MTLAQSRRIASKLRRSPEETAEDVYDAMPTTLYNRDDRSSGVLRAAPSDLRGWSPSHARANAPTLPARRWRRDAPTLSAKPSRPGPPSPLATFSLPSSRSVSASDGPRISEMLRDLPLMPPVDASRPLTCAPNPFLVPPDPNAPPPMWRAVARGAGSVLRTSEASQQARLRPRRRRSIMPFVTAAIAIAIGVGLWQDAAARTEVASDLAQAADRVSELVLEAAIR